MNSFSAKVSKIGVNPCVDVPDAVVLKLLAAAGTTNGPIPVRGTLEGKRFLQTVVKYRGAWRLYLNTQMRRDAEITVGDTARVRMEFDREPRAVPMHPKLTRALTNDSEARRAFEKAPPSHQREILRYLNSMKTEAAVDRNVAKVIRHLRGGKPKGR